LDLVGQFFFLSIRRPNGIFPTRKGIHSCAFPGKEEEEEEEKERVLDGHVAPPSFAYSTG
jgi:hypothetical protein